MKKLVGNLQLFFLLIFALSLIAKDIYVDLNSANPVPPYSTWNDASTTISAALAVAESGDKIFITNGTYYINTQLVVTAAVSIIGVNGYNDTVVARIDNPAITSRVFYVNANNALLTGLTISNGFANGAGVFLANGTISNCIITHCVALSNGAGAGIYIQTGMVTKTTVQFCTINGDPKGCGIYVGGNNVIIDDCNIVSNSIINSTYGLSGRGTAIAMGNVTNVIITNCFISSNYMHRGYGTGIGLNGQYCRIENCVFSNHRHGDGAGSFIYIEGGPHIIRSCRFMGYSNKGGIYSRNNAATNIIEGCIISGHSDINAAAIYIENSTNTEVRNCIVFGNAGGKDGGGIYQASGIALVSGGRAINCVVINNYRENNIGSSRGAGGVFLLDAYMANCIVYSNRIYLYSAGAGNTNWFSDICLVGTSVVESSCSTSLIHGINGNITNNPMFVAWPSGIGTNATGGDIHLLKSSPCINVGRITEWMQGGKDYDGNPRIDRVTGIPDMGVYEYIPPATIFIMR